MEQVAIGSVGAARARGQVAVLVDGENVSQDHAGQVIMRSLSFGALVVKRVYGNASKMPKWDSAPGFRLVHSGVGKNATDLLLAIEAVDLSHRGSVDTFVIVSSDRDFAHLAHHLRERSFAVVGMGMPHAPDAFRKACARFIEIGQPSAAETKVGEAPPTAPPAIPAPPEKRTPLDPAIRAVIQKHGDTIGRLELKVLGTKLQQEHKLAKSDCGLKNWRAYLQSRQDLYECEPAGDSARVRLRNPSP